MKLLNTDSLEYYLLYISSLVFLYFSLTILTHFLKSNFEVPNDLKEAVNTEPQNIKQKQLRWKFLLVSIFIKASTWIKAPYLFALYNRIHGFSRNEIGVLYAIDNISSLISGPFFGSLCDLYGRKKFCMLFCIFVVLHITFRVTGVNDLAYLAQIISGFSGSLIETAFESWINFEANSLFKVNSPEGLKEKNSFLREIFTK
jgi:predicted MFS family arabinose efflux permease